jgi:hypothetical protein
MDILFGTLLVSLAGLYLVEDRDRAGGQGALARAAAAEQAAVTWQPEAARESAGARG